MKDLGLKELKCIPCSQIKPSEICDYTAVNHELLKTKEIVFNEMLEALIGGILLSERHGGGLCTESMYRAVEKATEKPWSEIKELL